MKHLFWIFCLVWNAIFGEILFKNLGTCQAARQAAGMAPVKQDEEAGRCLELNIGELFLNERRLMMTANGPLVPGLSGLSSWWIGTSIFFFHIFGRIIPTD